MASPVAQTEESAVVAAPENHDEQNTVVCKIWLQDDTYIMVDRMTAQCSGVLVDLVNSIYMRLESGKDVEVVVVPVRQFESDRVRYVIGKAFSFMQLLPNFFLSKEFQSCFNELQLEEIIKLMEIANFLDLTAAMKCLGMVAGEKMKGMNGEELAQTLNFEKNATKEEQEEVERQTTWFYKTREY